MKLIIELADRAAFSFFISVDGVESRDVRGSLQRGWGWRETHQKEEFSCRKLLIIYIRQHVGIPAAVILISGSVVLAQWPRSVPQVIRTSSTTSASLSRL